MANLRLEKDVKKHAPFVWIFALTLLASVLVFFSFTNSPAALSGSSTIDIANSDINLKPVANLKVIGIPGQHDIALGFSLPCNEFEGGCRDISDYALRWRSDRMITQDNWDTSRTSLNAYSALVIDKAIENTFVEFEPDTTYFFAARYFSDGEWSSLSNIVIATTAEKI